MPAREPTAPPTEPVAPAEVREAATPPLPLADPDRPALETPDRRPSFAEVADAVDFRIDLGHSLLPPFEVPDGVSADQYLRQKVEEGLLWPDPLIQLNPSFQYAGTIDDLVAEGLLQAECSRVFRAGKDKGTTACRTGQVCLSCKWRTSE